MDSVEIITSKEAKRPRLDTETNLFDQLTSVFEEITQPGSTAAKCEAPSEIAIDGEVTIVHITDSSDEVKVTLNESRIDFNLLPDDKITVSF